MKKKPPINHSRRWSLTDQRVLVAMIKEGKSSSQIAKALGRTRSSILSIKSRLFPEESIQKGTSQSPLTFRKNESRAPRQGNGSRGRDLLGTEFEELLRITEKLSKKYKTPIRMILG